MYYWSGDLSLRSSAIRPAGPELSPDRVAMQVLQSNGFIKYRMESIMKYSLDAIPIEVLVLAVIEFVFMSAFAALLWYVFGRH